MKQVVIIGAGLSGLSTAYHLQQQQIPYKLFEKEKRPGGFCRTIKSKGFLFDMGVHVLWGTDIEWVKRLLEKELGVELEAITRKAAVCSTGVYTPYPYQSNLYGRPTEEIFDCVLGMYDSHTHRRISITKPHIDTLRSLSSSYIGWATENFGDGITKHFMIPYNKKFWKFPLEMMTAEWCYSTPVPMFEQVLRGALVPSDESFGGNATFYYPKTGGIETVVKAVATRVHVQTNTEIQSIYVNSKYVKTRTGSKYRYSSVVSSLPLYLLKDIIIDDTMPESVQRAFINLKYNIVSAICVGTSKPSKLQYHWVYYPDASSTFYRINFLEGFPGLVPTGKGAMIIEKSFSAHLEQQEPFYKFDPVVNEVRDAGLIRGDIETQFSIPLTPAYVIFDTEYRKNIDIITTYLTSKNIYTVGRYGNWEYSNMTTALFDGKELSEFICQKCV